MKNILKASVWADSILKGVLYDEEEKRYRISKRNAIIESTKDNDIKLENNCRFGLTTTKAIRLISSKINKEEKPNICLIELGGNDCDYKWSEVSENPNGNHLPNTTIEEYKKSIGQMVDTLRENDIKPVIVSLPPIDPERFVNWVSKGLNKETLMHFLGTKTRIYTHHEAYNLALLEVAKEKNTDLIDVRKSFLLDKNYNRFLCSDGIHLNDDGQVVMKSCFENYLLNYK